jgi:hypothetical protein
MHTPSLPAHVAEHTITIDLDDGGRRTFRQEIQPALASSRPAAQRSRFAIVTP